MDIERDFPLRFFLNLARRQDRRATVEDIFNNLSLLVERFPSIDSKRVKISPRSCRFSTDYRGYESLGRYALALSKRLALREAKRRGAPAVLLFEDDVVLHPNCRILLETVNLPDDWGICFLGCAHSRRPIWAGPRIVRVKYAVDHHAIAIRAPHYDRVMAQMDRHNKLNPGVAKASDQFVAKLAEEIPTYACYPNVAWQAVVKSDLKGERYSCYTSDGRQTWGGESVNGLISELVSGPEAIHNPIRIGFLFLTRGDVNHPGIWQEYFAEAPGAVRIFSHAKEHPVPHGSPLAGRHIGKHFLTEWGDISLVRATRELLLEALNDSALTHFVLVSESCVPIRPLSQLLRDLKLDPRSRFLFRTYDQEPLGHKKARFAQTYGIPNECRRFQSQWWLMDRPAAVFASGQDFTALFEKMFAPDESYFATVLSMQGFPLHGEVVNQRSTWVHWEGVSKSPTEWEDITSDVASKLISSGSYFGRKFSKSSNIGTYGLHRAVPSLLPHD